MLDAPRLDKDSTLLRAKTADFDQTEKMHRLICFIKEHTYIQTYISSSTFVILKLKCNQMVNSTFDNFFVKFVSHFRPKYLIWGENTGLI